ncbi:MAG: hypothetical protein LC128_05510 [Chitinophagales bacterium]|nr:hypothetical protein [Chitinophagales bacterium]
MKPVFSLLAMVTVAIAFSSCTTAYKTGQTPDDVYYSPTQNKDEYLRVNNYDDQSYNGDDYYDDRYLRMKVHNPQLWSALDDWYYYGDRYNYGYGYYNNYSLNSWGYAWNPYSYWNSYYNPYYYNYVTPYYGHVIILNPGAISNTYSAPRTVNLNNYNNNRRLLNEGLNVKNPNRSGFSSNKFNSKPASSSNSGSFLRNIFNGGNSNNSTSAPPRVSNSSSGSTKSSSGSTAPVRKF